MTAKALKIPALLMLIVCSVSAEDKNEDQIIPKIVNGGFADEDEYPFMARLLIGKTQ